METKLSQEQKKELLEWCGLQIQEHRGGQYWYEPDGTLIGWGCFDWCPDIDLNNLFRWAVPKAIEMIAKHGMTSTTLVLSGQSAFRVLMEKWSGKNPVQFGFENTLVWTIWEVSRRFKGG